MNSPESGATPANARLLRALTCVMFLMFAMTSDAVGSIIPKVIEDFRLSLKEAGAFHYVPMAAIAIGALFLGFLADRLGRKATVLAGLGLYGAGSVLFAVGDSFGFFVGLLAICGIGISVFKIGALALVGDISRSSKEHTATMNTVEGFFGVGAMIGPAIVATLLAAGWSWKWLYVIAACMCAVLMAIAARVQFPPAQVAAEGAESVDLRRTLRMMGNPYALLFSGLIALYVATEVAIYVWMPTYLQSAAAASTAAPIGPAWLVTYALTVFFVLRAAGRFLGVWLLAQFRWTTVLALFGLAMFACFAGSYLGGATAGVWLLPLSGLFMSMLYPTLNSKGISCFAKHEHGAAAGVTLFFTAAAAAAGPLAMAAVADAAGGDTSRGFLLATGFAALLAAGLVFNWLRDPAAKRLAELDACG